MGLIEIFFKTASANGQFVSEKAYFKNREKLVNNTPKTLEQMRKMNVTEEKEIKLEYTFYTNTAEKAGQLATEIWKLGYTVEHGIDPDKKNLYMISGITTNMKTTDEAILHWTDKMCEIGYQFDCEFDGWVTDINME